MLPGSSGELISPANMGHPSREEGFSPTGTAARIYHILGDVLT